MLLPSHYKEDFDSWVWLGGGISVATYLISRCFDSYTAIIISVFDNKQQKTNKQTKMKKRLYRCWKTVYSNDTVSVTLYSFLSCREDSCMVLLLWCTVVRCTCSFWICNRHGRNQSTSIVLSTFSGLWREWITWLSGLLQQSSHSG